MTHRKHPGPTCKVDMSDLHYRGYWIRRNALLNSLWIERDGYYIVSVPPTESWGYARRVIDELVGVQ